MFCPYCGSNVDDKAVTCPACGANVTVEQSNPVVPTNPQFDTNTPEPIIPDVTASTGFQSMPPMPAAAPTYDNQPKLGKGKYIKQIGSKKVKVLSKVVWAMLAIIVLILALSVNTVVRGAVTEIPVVAMVIPENETTNLLEDVDGLDEMIDEAESLLDEAEDELSAKEFDVIKKVLNDVKKFAENPSVSNTKTVVASLTEAAKIAEKYPEQELLSEHFAAADFAEELSEPMKILDVVIYIIIAFAAFIALLALLATLLKKSGIAVFALLLSEVLCFLFAGPVYCVLIALTYIAMIVMFAIINKEYKVYRKGI